jgi:preprotein translocase subunit SecE
MGVETKKMANSIAAAGDNFGDRLRSWPERIRAFYHDVRTEMKKVTSPSWKEVQGTTTVVIITVFLFALYFFLVDLAISNTLERGLHYFSRH